jgi:hypothetical protein
MRIPTQQAIKNAARQPQAGLHNPINNGCLWQQLGNQQAQQNQTVVRRNG